MTIVDILYRKLDELVFNYLHTDSPSERWLIEMEIELVSRRIDFYSKQEGLT